MDAQQRKLYNKLKKQQSRSRMSKEEKEAERNADKVGMHEYRLNISWVPRVCHTTGYLYRYLMI